MKKVERKRQSAKVGSFGERKRWWSVLLEFCVKKNHTHLCKAGSFGALREEKSCFANLWVGDVQCA